MENTNRKKDKGTTIWLTTKEQALIAESKELFSRFTGIKKISWGAYICALSLGSLTAEALIGVVMKCPDCGREVEIKLVNPRLELPRRSRQGQKTV